MAQQQTEGSKSLEALLNETISETREKSPQSNDQEYDRDQLREIAEQFSRRYVTLIRSGEGSHSI